MRFCRLLCFCLCDAMFERETAGVCRADAAVRAVSRPGARWPVRKRDARETADGDGARSPATRARPQSRGERRPVAERERGGSRHTS